MIEKPTNNENMPGSLKVRRSFRLLSMDVILYLCGLALIDQSTVLPAFLATLTKSSIVIGSIIAIKSAGLFLPQLWTAHYLRNRRRHKGFLMKVAAISRAGITLFAVVLFLAKPNDRIPILAAFIIMYAAFWLSEGGAGVPWTDLVAKTIPERLRGRLFGFTQVGGGILGLLAGLFISRILGPGGPSYPLNYAVLFGVAAFFFAVSYFSLLAVREPDGPPEDHDGDFLRYIRAIGRTLSKDLQLKRLLIVQMLIGFVGLSWPFYVLFAKETLGIGGSTIGIYLTVQVAGSIVWSIAAGYLSDRIGPKFAIILSVIAGVLAPLLALVTGGLSVWLYGLVFFAVGGIGSVWIGLTNFILELAPDKERRSYIGIANSANAPTILFPVLGGLIVQMASYQAVFIITAAALALAFILALGLRPGNAV